jgi:CelD/BcsL family acetyltransferase involved in cellulose biosynthesis
MSNLEIQNRIEPLVSEWEWLARQTKASPFLWPGWINAWWHAFGTGQLQILAVYENGHLTGVLPLHQFRGTLSSTTNSRTPLFGFLAANEPAAKQLSQALFPQKPRSIDLSFLAPTDAGVLLTRTAASEASYRVQKELVPAAPYMTIAGS